MIEKVLWALVTALGGGVLWVARAVFLARPRLSIRYKRADGQSSGASSTMLKVRWGYTVTISNLSKHDALEVEVVSSTVKELQPLPTHHIAALQDLVLNLNMVKTLERSTVVDAQHDFHGRLEPVELRDFAAVLRYKSEIGLRFYTVYRRSGGVDANQYVLRAPPGPNLLTADSKQAQIGAAKGPTKTEG
jgi:hypothetical protein